MEMTDRTRNNDRFRLIVESAPNAMVLVNHLGKIDLVNAETERLFGYSRKDLLGSNVEMLIPSRFIEKHPGNRNGFFANPVSRSMGVGRDLFCSSQGWQ